MTVKALRRGSIAASRVTAVPFTGLAVAMLDQAATTTGTDPVVSASVSPTANALVVVWVGATGAGGAPVGCSGCGITFTRSGEFYDGANRAVALFAGSSASPTSGAISVDLAATPTGHAYRIEEWTASATPGVRQTKTGSSASSTTGASITLDNAPQASSATAGLILAGGSAIITAGSDFTAGLNASYSTPTARAFTEYDIVPVDGTVDCSWSSGGDAWSGTAAEIGAPL